jgi:hypothetical protein
MLKITQGLVMAGNGIINSDINKISINSNIPDEP